MEAEALRKGMGAPVFCGDPRSKVKEPLEHVTYLPEDLPFSGNGGAADWIAQNWFSMPGPWVCEGHVMARALRRWFQDDLLRTDGSADASLYPCDLIYVYEEQREDCDVKPGQVAMHKGVMRVWSEVALYFEPITVYRSGDGPGEIRSSF
jgi:hypothetical protein